MPSARTQRIGATMSRPGIDLSAPHGAPAKPERDEIVLVTLLTSARMAHLAACLGADVHLLRADRHLQPDASGELEPHGIVVDPLLAESAMELDGALRAIRTAYPVVVYTSVTPAAMRRLLDVPSLAGATLVLAGIDDTPHALRATIGGIRDSAHRRRALSELEARAGRLPPEVARALAALLVSPRELSVIALARASNMCVRTLERRLYEVGAPQPLWLVRTARAVLARELLRSSDLTVEEVACRVGYTKVESLRALLRWSFHSSPSALREGRERASAPRTGYSTLRRVAADHREPMLPRRVEECRECV
jgi:AraC-like DNA-binding protein